MINVLGRSDPVAFRHDVISPTGYSRLPLTGRDVAWIYSVCSSVIRQRRMTNESVTVVEIQVALDIRATTCWWNPFERIYHRKVRGSPVIPRSFVRSWINAMPCFMSATIAIWQDCVADDPLLSAKRHLEGSIFTYRWLQRKMHRWWSLVNHRHLQFLI